MSKAKEQAKKYKMSKAKEQTKKSKLSKAKEQTNKCNQNHFQGVPSRQQTHSSPAVIDVGALHLNGQDSDGFDPPGDPLAIKLWKNNNQLMETISKLDHLGRHAETVNLKWQLFGNLTKLAVMQKFDPPLPPGPVPPPGKYYNQPC